MGFSFETLSLSDSEFAILRDLIRERTGLHYENNKRSTLAERLSPRAMGRGFDAFIDYYYLLKYGPGSEEEWLHVLDALSVQETYFWREIDQVRALVDVIVPQYFAAPHAEALHIWSAPCATGEEPLSIAIALNEAGWFERGRIVIRASDGSTAAIQKARKGVYTGRSFRSLPEPLRHKYFVPVEGAWKVIPEIHQRIHWGTVNLMSQQEVAAALPATVVFCRNVFIYFSPDAIARTIRLFSTGMSRPGYLFVGVSESLLRHTTDFELQEIGGAFVYVQR